MNKIHDSGKEVKISFQNRKKLIQFVSKYLAYMYQKEVFYWRAHLMDAPLESFTAELKVRVHAPIFQSNMRKLLKRRLQHNPNVVINSDSCILKRAFKMSGIDYSPSLSFAGNIEYEIRDLVFITKYK